MKDKSNQSHSAEAETEALVNKNVSRRSFLKGAGLTTAGTVMVSSGVMAFDRPKPQAKKAIGPGATTINLRVNGKTRTIAVEPRTTLATALREHLQLTGTKIVCDRGSCSACTVWLDDQPVNSCLMLAVEVGDSEITTVEGLSKNGQLHPVQEAFIEHDATQCGFCTPGMVMTTAHLLRNNPDPSLEDVRHAVRGNLCRCGTHPNVFKATMAAAKKS